MLAVALATVICLGEWNGVVRGAVGRPLLALSLDVALVALLGIALAGWRRGAARPHIQVADGLILGYAVMSAAWILHSNVPDFATGLEGFRKAGFPISAYLLMRMALVADAGPLVRLFILGSIPAFLFGIRQYFLPWPIDGAIVSSSGISWTTFMQADQLRAFSPTSGPFHLGMLAGAAVIAGTVLTRVLGRRWVAPTAIAAVTLVLTLTRAIWIGTLVGAVAAVAVLLMAARDTRSHGDARRRLRTMVRIALLAGGLAILCTIAFAVFLAGTPTGDSWIALLQSVIDPLGARNLQLRLEYWRGFIDAIQASPLVGYGTSAAADGFGSTYVAAGRSYFYPHSIYFKPFLELGIVGFLLFTGGLLAIGRSAVESVRLAPLSGSIAVGVLLLTVVSGLTGPMLDTYPFNLLFWAIAGIAVNIASAPRGYLQGKIPTAD